MNEAFFAPFAVRIDVEEFIPAGNEVLRILAGFVGGHGGPVEGLRGAGGVAFGGGDDGGRFVMRLLEIAGFHGRLHAGEGQFAQQALGVQVALAAADFMSGRVFDN